MTVIDVDAHLEPAADWLVDGTLRLAALHVTLDTMTSEPFGDR